MEACTGCVVVVGRDRVGRWIGAETQAALSRHFGPHDDAERLRILPIPGVARCPYLKPYIRPKLSEIVV
jgi:hypothetical protein